MFYSDAILSKRGPLGRVWLAAHMERKLSKTQTLQTDIEESVEAIIGEEVEIMALRLSGQLLLGVVRIYNRKAKYLLDDCNEAMLKLKMAFRAGPVDMTNAQMTVDRNAITLQADALDLDILLPDINWDMDFEDRLPHTQASGRHVARQADITLASAADLEFDLADRYELDLGPSDGIGSQDFELGLDFGGGPRSATGEADESVEFGRDAAPMRRARDSLASHLLGKGDMEMDVDLDLMSRGSRAPSEQPFNADMDLGLGPDATMDLGDFGISFGGDDHPMSDREKTPGQTRSPMSPLTEPPQTPPAEFNLPEPIPDADADAVVADAGVADADAATPKPKKLRKEKKQIVDSVTELADGGPGARVARNGRGGDNEPAKDNSAILTTPSFLPRSPLVMRLLAIRDDPLAHFLPTRPGPDGTTLFCAAPPGLAPELAELFMRPVRGAQVKRRTAEQGKDDAPSSKRRRLGSAAPEDEEELEVGRRDASAAPSVVLGSAAFGRASVVPDAGLDISFQDNSGMGDFEMDVPMPEIELPQAGRSREPSMAPSERSRSRLSTPGVEEGEEGRTFAGVACPIAAFDVRQSQSQEQEQKADKEDGKGYSKNTVKALALIRKELQPSEDDDEDEKVLSFKKVSEKASRRAAASFFFELLVLSTRDCIKVSQADPFGNTEIRAKDKLWERQRHASVAASIGSAMGL